MVLEDCVSDGQFDLELAIPVIVESHPGLITNIGVFAAEDENTASPLFVRILIRTNIASNVDKVLVIVFPDLSTS